MSYSSQNQNNDHLFDPPVDIQPFSFAERLNRITVNMKKTVNGKLFWLSCIFLPLYIWSILFYPMPLLWWISLSAALLFLSLVIIWPRSILYWLPASILLFNTLYFWLPWPGVKVCYIASSAVCIGILINSFIKKKEIQSTAQISFDFKILLISLFAAAVIGVLINFEWKEYAAWYELKFQLRQMPFLDEKQKYVSLRYLWMWLIAVSLYSALSRIIRNLKDIQVFLWSIEITTIPIIIFGIYSYVSRKYMVAHYMYEHRINATFSSPAVLADVFSVVFIIGTYLLLETKSLIKRTFLLLLLAAQLVIIFMSGCRTNLILVIVFLCICLFIYLFRVIKRTRWYISLSIAGAFLILICGGIYSFSRITNKKITKIPALKRLEEWKQGIKRGKSLKKTFLKGRAEHWAAAGNMIKKSPVWGIGTGLFEQNYVKYHNKKDLFWYARTHCVPLRVCAEGGYVTLTIFLFFLLINAARLSYGFTSRARRKEPKWSRLTRTFFIIFVIMFLSSLFTDVFYENPESVMFLSIMACCASIGYHHLARLVRQHFLLINRKIWFHEENINMMLARIGWGYLGRIKFSIAVKIIVSILLLIFIFIGVSNANMERMGRDISHGFYSNNNVNMFFIGKSALIATVIKAPVFSFNYSAFDMKMAMLNQTLKLYINGKLTSSLPLNRLSSRKLNCDVSGLIGKKAFIEFRVTPVFTPFKEKWFKDNRPHGALVTKLSWYHDDIDQIYAKTGGDWNIRWSDRRDFYIEQGLTNRIIDLNTAGQ